MRLAIFDDQRLGVVSADGESIADVTAALPWPHDPDPVGAGWYVRLCRDFARLRADIEAAARQAARKPLASVRLKAPVLNPTKIVACASNYGAHVQEMVAVNTRTAGEVLQWQMEFDVFLKAPSSIVGPRDGVLLPEKPVKEGREIHHESELALVIGGPGGAHIPEAEAMRHIMGYTVALDMTVRGQGDRSRRKSYHTFTPIGPWITTADEIEDPHRLDIRLLVGSDVRQDVNTRDLTTKIPAIIAYASSVMRLEPGDVVLTGAPPGVNQVRDGDVMVASIGGIGSMQVPVRADRGASTTEHS